MKKFLKIFGIVLLSIIVVAAVAFGIFWYHNTHWYDKYEKALKTTGAVEKQITLPNGNVINYGEVSNDKPALLLIHGQMGLWEESFAYLDTYKPLHDWNHSDKSECWESYYLRHC